MKMITVNGKREKLEEITITARHWYGSSSGTAYVNVKVWLNDVVIGTHKDNGADPLYAVTHLIEKYNKNLCKALLEASGMQQTNIGTGKLEYVPFSTVRRVGFEKHGIVFHHNTQEVKLERDLSFRD